MTFKLVSDYSPNGDQPQAIEALSQGLRDQAPHQILLGVTGSGKTFTMANVIQTVQRPTLVIAHNKTLAAQLCSEFRSFFPDNAVEYFVSYYDYYQPEAYIASRDVYIEKEADINDEIERLRHRCTRALLTRSDVIVVASVSAIYGLGVPEDYLRGVISLKVGQEISRRDLLLSLTQIQYERNDVALERGRFRVHGDSVDIYPSWEEAVYRLSFFGDELEQILVVDPVSGEITEEKREVSIFPATHYVVHDLDTAMEGIRTELDGQLEVFSQEKKVLESHRLKQRTEYDLEMMAEMGYCKGIENYSRHLYGRSEGDPGSVLLDFFPDNFITIIDESHVTFPQIRGMYHGDRSRKEALVSHGFRLPSAMDNRPLMFEEFEKRVGPWVAVSATPGPYELTCCDGEFIEQVIRPTGLLDPEVDLKPTLHQMDDLISSIQPVLARKERVLVTTLTKKMSEDLTLFLEEKGLKVRYLHSDILTLERMDILHDLRAGVFDVLVGVNLLREGLDLPEVSLVAIFDADKEGFLRNERSLIQTMGRAARNVNGRVTLYADKITESMKKAISETERRRGIQQAYNQKHGIVPETVKGHVVSIRSEQREVVTDIESQIKAVTPASLPQLVAKLEKDMQDAAERLEFELAAVLRDQLEDLKQKEIL